MSNKRLLTCIEDVSGTILRLQSIPLDRIKNKEFDENDIIYWSIDLKDSLNWIENSYEANGKVYIESNSIQQVYNSLKPNIYYETLVKSKYEKEYNTFKIKKENKIISKLTLEKDDYYISFSIQHHITNEFKNRLISDIKEMKKEERINNYFFKILSEEENDKLNSFILLLDSKEIEDVSINDLLLNGEVTEAMEKLISLNGIGIKTLSLLLNKFNEDEFTIYNHDMYRYLEYNKLIESKSKEVEKYKEYCKYISTVINKACRFKSLLMLYSEDELREKHSNQIKLINSYLYYNFSIFDLLIYV